MSFFKNDYTSFLRENLWEMADALAIILGAIGGLFFIGCICCCGDPCCDPDYGTPVRRSSVSSPNLTFNNQVNTEVATSIVKPLWKNEEEKSPEFLTAPALPWGHQLYVYNIYYTQQSLSMYY